MHIRCQEGISTFITRESPSSFDWIETSKSESTPDFGVPLQIARGAPLKVGEESR